MKRNETSSSIAGYVVCQCLLGYAVGLGCASLILATDAAGLRSLIAASPQPKTATVIFLAGSVITFVPLVLATAIGLLAAEDDA